VHTRTAELEELKHLIDLKAERGRSLQTEATAQQGENRELEMRLRDKRIELERAKAERSNNQDHLTRVDDIMRQSKGQNSMAHSKMEELRKEEAIHE